MLSKFKTSFVIVCIALYGNSALAVAVNSVCTMRADSKTGQIDGDARSDEKFTLASISKVVTSLWAVEKLGPNFRFKTKIHVTPVSKGFYDIHIEGARDPIFGRNAGYFLISELVRNNIHNVRELTFDQNFLISWELETHGAGVLDGETKPHNVTDALKSVSTGLATSVSTNLYNSLSAVAKVQKIVMTPYKDIDVKIGSVNYLAKENFQKKSNTTTMVYQSATLKRILKNMNNSSNNYIADHLFWDMGGPEAFQKFIKQSLSIDTDEMKFYIGSGNNAHYLPGFGGVRTYNQATCEAMIKVLFKLNGTLESQGLSLTDVMAVPGIDKTSTVRSSYAEMNGSGVAKTGTVATSKTLAGSISTNDGKIYFVILVDRNKGSSSKSPTQVIKDQLANIVKKYHGKKNIKYQEVIPLPFDNGSYLIKENNISQGTKG